MNLSVRLFLGYFLLVGIAIGFVVRTFTDELVPGMRQSLEEVLVDTANLMAVQVADEVRDGRVASGEFSAMMERYAGRPLDARIWFMKKRDPSLIVYITDQRGSVIYDSRGRDLGKDYSRWNDVYLTLQGKYGARTTREEPADEFSSVMYVAAPITHEGNIIGVLTVGKPSVAVYPFVQAARENIEQKGMWILLAALLVGLLLTYGMTQSIRQLTHYARAVQEGRRVVVPKLRERELAQLAEAMEAMRVRLEGKDYVENYLHTLTHEMKSPLAAIQGAAELLEESMAPERRAAFVANIRNESARLGQLVERLLGLAEVEKRSGLHHLQTVSLRRVVSQLVADKNPMVLQKGLTVASHFPDDLAVEGELFLLQQAVSNLLDNAIAFSPAGGTLTLTGLADNHTATLLIDDAGPGIPAYARERIFERFYSLPRPDGGQKSTGLGLSLVREVVQLHGGEIVIDNRPEGGARAHLRLPVQQHTA
ncbi:MAG TPA: two-component system sensor histidine kinase CreC [Gammaproteobacteria bacterium]